MNKRIDGGPAFPIPWEYVVSETGMSLRDYFAGQALTGLLVNYNSKLDSPESAAELADAIADAMIARRDQ